MTGRHEGPPLGSAAREATAAPWHGKHRADDSGWWHGPLPALPEKWAEPEPDDPPRCWSCGHTTDMFCECQCCNDDHDGGPDDV